MGGEAVTRRTSDKLSEVEVELLRDSHLAVGWSGAMSQASAWDHQARGLESGLGV